MICWGLATTWALSPCTVRRPALRIGRESGSVVLMVRLATCVGCGRRGLAAAELAAVTNLPFGTPGMISLMLSLLGLELGLAASKPPAT